MEETRRQVNKGIPNKGSHEKSTSVPQQIVRLHKDGNEFEVITETGAVLQIQNGQRTWEPSILKLDRIYINANSGEVASHNLLESAFGTHNVLECAREICENGSVVLNQQQRTAQREHNVGHNKRLVED
jgi:ribosome maturation protein Sdo1